MTNMRQWREQRSRGTDINMAPLIDMIFILLIFFLVTTSFVKESGVEVKRPAAASAEPQPQAQMIIGINPQGQVYIEGRQIPLQRLQQRMADFHAQQPGASVVVAADRNSRTNTLMQVLDACRMAGVEDVSLAAAPEQ